MNVQETSDVHTALAADRRRIARDLHDSALSEITGVALALHSVRHLLPTPERAKLDHAIHGLDSVIRSVREAVFELTNQAEPLRDQLIRLVRHFDALCIHDLSLSTSAILPVLNQNVQCDVIAVITEAITNAAKYSEATVIDVDVRWEQEELQLIVTDDGIGVSLDTVTPGLSTTSGNGLPNMAYRADRNGGTFTVRSGETGGTTVRWTIPLAQSQATAMSRPLAQSIHHEASSL